MRISLALVCLVVLSSCTEKEAPAPPAPASAPASVPKSATPKGMVVLGDGTAGLSDDPVRFHKPIRLAPCGKGCVLVADINNHAIRVLEKSDGTWRVRTLVGGPDKAGHLDGPVAQAKLNAPHGVAFVDGKVIIAEASGHAIRQVSGLGQDAIVRTLAGKLGEAGDVDGPAAEARFSSPHGIVSVGDGGVLIADIGNKKLKLLKKGRVETLISEGLIAPISLTYDPSHKASVLITDAGHMKIFRYHLLDGRLETVKTAPLKTPHGVAAGGAMAMHHRFYVAELSANRITEQPSGKLILDGLKKPADVLDHDGHLFVADLGHHQLKVFPLP